LPFAGGNLAILQGASGPSRTGIADIRSDLGQASNTEESSKRPSPEGVENRLAASLQLGYSPIRGRARFAGLVRRGQIRRGEPPAHFERNKWQAI